MLDSLNSDERILTFEQLVLRCDSSGSDTTNQFPWSWSMNAGERLSVMTNNSFLGYQLMAMLCGLIKPVSGDFVTKGSLSWPLAGQGGLDSKTTIGNGFEFLSSIYGDCLERSLISTDEFFDLLNSRSIDPSMCIKDLAKEQKDFFYAILSIIFRFDIYLAPHSKYLMSKEAKLLRDLLQKQLSNGVCMISTANNNRFRREFCNRGMVLGSSGEVMFHGDLEEAIAFSNRIDSNNNSSGDNDTDNEFDFGKNLTNSDQDLNYDQDDGF